MRRCHWGGKMIKTTMLEQPQPSNERHVHNDRREHRSTSTTSSSSSSSCPCSNLSHCQGCAASSLSLTHSVGRPVQFKEGICRQQHQLSYNAAIRIKLREHTRVNGAGKTRGSAMRCVNKSGGRRVFEASGTASNSVWQKWNRNSALKCCSLLAVL